MKREEAAVGVPRAPGVLIIPSLFSTKEREGDYLKNRCLLRSLSPMNRDDLFASPPKGIPLGKRGEKGGVS